MGHHRQQSALYLQQGEGGNGGERAGIRAGDRPFRTG